MAKSAHAYTPGLKVTRRSVVRKRRILPIQGTVLVKEGDEVRRDDVVARTELPGNVQTVNVVNLLGISPDEIEQFMLKKEGDTVADEEVIAETRPFIKWFKSVARSPAAGTLESVSRITGQVMVREPPRPVEVRAYVDGRIAKVMPEEGVEVESFATFIQGIFGVGGETWGDIVMVAEPGERLSATRIRPEHKGKIVVGGSLVDGDALRRAVEAGVAAVVSGGMHDEDLRSLLGYDIGVAITGQEEIGLTAVITEGFGEIAMARRTWDLLGEHEGRTASISGATQIRAGVLRPEIIVPLESAEDAASPSAAVGSGLKAGDRIRAIRRPWFGHLGCVKDLPSELQEVESGSRVRVLEVEFDEGTSAVVPRANVEIIEQ
jgi:hypothetical protein